MIALQVTQREIQGKKVSTLRKEGILPAVLYGPKTEAQQVQVDEKDFQAVYKEAGESTLVSLKMGEKETPVMIYDTQRDALTGKVLHVDFYETPLDKKIEVTVPLIFEGEAPAVGDMGGTLVRNIQEIQVRAFPQSLPSDITVNIEGLKTFEDRVLVKDLVQSEEVELVRDEDDLVAQVVPAVNVEAELEKSVEAPVVEEGEEEEGAEESGEESTEEGGDQPQEEEKKEE